VYQEIGWPFLFKGLLIGTSSYFDADATTQSKLSRVCTWFCQGVYKGVCKGSSKGVSGNRVAFPIQRSPNRNMFLLRCGCRNTK
jgi:hypothetical protein